MPGFLTADAVVQLQRYSGEGGRGSTFTSSTALRGGWEERRRVVSTAEGADVMAEATLFLEPDVPAVSVQSKVSFEGTTYEVVQVLRPRNLRGQVYSQELLLAP